MNNDNTKINKPVKKYFEIELKTPRKWDLYDYSNFLLETTYSIIVPFFIGFFISESHNILWIIFLILPIYIKFRIAKHETPKDKKKIYIK